MGRHVGGTIGLSGIRSKGATTHQIAVVNGSTFPGVVDPAGEAAGETSADLFLSDLSTEDTAGESEAVLVGAGPGGTVDVDLDGAASTLDARFRLESAGGTLTVAGGHPLTMKGRGDALAIVAPASVSLAGMSVTFHADVPAAARGVGLRVTGGQATSISGTRVEGAAVGIAVEGGSSATFDSTSVLGSRDHGVVVVADGVTMADVVVDGGAGTAVGVRSATDASLVRTVARNAAAGIDLAGTGRASLSGSTVLNVSGVGIRLRAEGGDLCADLVENDVTETGDVNFDLVGSGLADFRSSGHPGETVEDWLIRKQNTTVGGGELRSADVRSC